MVNPTAPLRATHWILGAFLTIAGTLMLVTPHQVEALHLYAGGVRLEAVGLVALVAGFALFHLAVLPYSRVGVLLVHLLAGVVMLAVASGYYAGGALPATAHFAVLGGGIILTGLAPAGFWRRVPPRFDALATMVGVLGLVLAGIFLLHTSPLRPGLPATGAGARMVLGGLFGLGGLLLLLVQSVPALGERRVMRWAARLVAVAAILSFAVLVVLPAMVWMAMAACAAMLVAMLLPPALAGRLSRFSATSLRGRVGFLLATSAGLPLVVTVALISHREEELVRRQALERERSHVAVLAQSVSQYLKLNRASVDLLANRPDLMRLPYSAHQDLVSRYDQAYPDLVGLATYDSAGRLVASSSGATRWQSVADWPTFRIAATLKREAMEIRSPDEDRVSFVFTRPVLDDRGVFRGMVVAELDAWRVGGFLWARMSDEHDLAYLVDAQGRTIFHRDRALMARRADLSGTPAVTAALRNGDTAGSMVIRENAHGEEKFVTFAHVPDMGMTIVVEDPARSVLAAVHTGRELGLLVLVLCLGSTIAAGVVVAHFLTAPLEALSHAASSLAAGNDEAPLPRSGILEVAQLAARFREMRDGLRRQREARIQAQQQLEEANASLEVAIAQRTAELRSELAQRVSAQQALARSQRLLEQVANASPDVLYLYDLNDGRCVYANRRVSQMLGYGPGAAEELVNDLPAQLRHPDEPQAAVERQPYAALQDGEVMEQEFQLPHAEGGKRWFRTREVVFHRLEDGAPGQIVGVGQDITAHKETEQAIQRARVDAEEANRAKDHFLAVLSHELRTPLTPALLLAQSLEKDSGMPSDQRDQVRTIRRNIELEARLIDDLLDLTRITRGKLALKKVVLDVHEQVREVVAICHHDLAQRQLRLVIDLGARQRYVLGDAARFQQILWNLLKNAIKFTPPQGLITIRTSDEGEMLLIEVLDTGIGIPRESLPRIFDAFEQGGRQITRRFGGLGLGLAITNALVQLHDGRIAAHSDGVNCGATFRIHVPALQEVPLGAQASGSGQRPEDTSASVLLVEDNVDTARVMARLLTLQGYKVQTAHSVAAALALSYTHHFDVLVSDIGLPDGTGLDLMRQLRKRGPVKAIAVSGFGMEDDVNKSREAGFSAHVTKPVDFPALHRHIQDLLQPPPASVEGTSEALR